MSGQRQVGGLEDVVRGRLVDWEGIAAGLCISYCKFWASI